MDVEKTIEFLLQSQAQHDAALARIEAAQARDRELLEEFKRDTQEFKRATQEAHVKLEVTVLTLGEHMIHLTKDQIQTREDLKTQGESINALIRVLDDLIRRNGGNKN